MCVLCRSQRLKNGSYDTSLPAIRKRVEKYRVQRVKHDLANLVAIDREVLLDLLDDALDVLERDNASESVQPLKKGKCKNPRQWTEKQVLCCHGGTSCSCTRKGENCIS